MSNKPKSRLEVIAIEAEKHAKAKKAAPAAHDAPAMCPACHQPLPQDAGGSPASGPEQNG